MSPKDGQVQDLLNKDAATGKLKSVVANSFKLDPKNPIPLDYGADSFQVVFGKKYIPFLGVQDNLPNILWESRFLSTTQNACISSIAQTCIGKGLYVKNVEEDKVDPEFISWISKINNDGQSLNEICRTILDAMQTDGNAWIEIVKGSFADKSYVKVYLYTTLVCRLAIPDIKTGRVISILKSNALAKPRNGLLNARSLKAVSFPIYSDNPLDKKTAWSDLKADKASDGSLHTMIHLKNEVPGLPYYGIPKSIASLRYQVLEGKAAQYNIDMFDNNMIMSALLIFKSAMGTEEASATAQEIVKTHTGQGKQGRVGVISSEGGIDDFTYQPLNTEKEGSYTQLDERVEQKIITSHGWDSTLAGISSKNNHPFSNGSQYVRSVFDVKKAMVMEPMNAYVINKFIKVLVAIAADEFKKPAWKTYDLDFKVAMPFSLISDIEVNNVLTKDEGREIIGKGPMKDKAKGEEIIGTRVSEVETPGNSKNNTKPDPNVP